MNVLVRALRELYNGAYESKTNPQTVFRVDTILKDIYVDSETSNTQKFLDEVVFTFYQDCISMKWVTDHRFIDIFIDERNKHDSIQFIHEKDTAGTHLSFDKRELLLPMILNFISGKDPHTELFT